MHPLDPTEVLPPVEPRARSDSDTAAESAETPRHHVDTTVAQATASTASGSYQAGDRIGRYQVRRLLGEGAFGRVYACWDDQLAREVAIKTSKRHFAGGEQLAAFLREAQAAAKLRHPGIVQVYDVGQQASGEPFVVMELVSGESLADLAAREKLSPVQIARLMAQTAEAAAHAHQHDLVHRDIKPSNIWIDQTGAVRLLDFGLALDDARRFEHRGELAGTFAYMSPEQVSRQAHRLDGRSDIWPLGVILYELLTGRRPFTGKTADEITDEILHRDPRPPRQLKLDAPAELERICLKCLAKQATDRYATASDLAADLKRFAHRTTAPASRGPLLAVAAVSLLVIAVVLATGGFGGRQAAPPPPENFWGVDVFLGGAEEKAIRLTTQPVALVNGDAVQIWAKLPQPRYLAVAWIDGEGKVGVVYPPSAVGSQPLTELRQPPEKNRGFPVEGSGGVETAVLIVSPDPLPATDKLEAALAPKSAFPRLGDFVLLDGVDVQPERLGSGSDQQQLLARAGRRSISTTAANLSRSESLAALDAWKAAALSRLPQGVELHYLAIPHVP